MPPQLGGFFAEEVEPLLGRGAGPVVVIISDALRYEVAHELAERLERQTRGICELSGRGAPSPRSRAWAWRRCSRPPRSSSDSLLRVRMGASGCGDLPSSLMGFTPRGYLRVAQPGAGEAFVHGGTSLQELCVPVLRFRNLRRGSRGYVEAHAARIALLGASRSITAPRVALDIQQLDAVAGKVCPALYEVCFEDASGERLSSTVRVRTDRREVNGCAGTISVRLDLTRLPSDGSRDAFLVARVEQGGEVVRERFSLDLVAGALTPGLA